MYTEKHDLSNWGEVSVFDVVRALPGGEFEVDEDAIDEIVAALNEAGMDGDGFREAATEEAERFIAWLEDEADEDEREEIIEDYQAEARRECERIAEGVEYGNPFAECAGLEEAFGAVAADYVRRMPEGWEVDYVAILRDKEELEDVGMNGDEFVDKALAEAEAEADRRNDEEDEA